MRGHAVGIADCSLGTLAYVADGERGSVLRWTKTSGADRYLWLGDRHFDFNPNDTALGTASGRVAMWIKKPDTTKTLGIHFSMNSTVQPGWESTISYWWHAGTCAVTGPRNAQMALGNAWYQSGEWVLFEMDLNRDFGTMFPGESITSIHGFWLFTHAEELWVDGVEFGRGGRTVARHAGAERRAVVPAWVAPSGGGAGDLSGGAGFDAAGR